MEECLVDEDTVELYSCWSGEEDLSVEHERVVPLAELQKETFGFLERQRTVVRPNSDSEMSTNDSTG